MSSLCLCVRYVALLVQAEYIRSLGATAGVASIASSAMPFAGVFSILLTGYVGKDASRAST